MGQCQSPRRPVEKARAQFRFETRHSLGNSRFRELQFLGGTCKRVHLHNLCKDRQAVQIRQFRHVLTLETVSFYCFRSELFGQPLSADLVASRSLPMTKQVLLAAVSFVTACAITQAIAGPHGSAAPGAIFGSSQFGRAPASFSRPTAFFS